MMGRVWRIERRAGAGRHHATGGGGIFGMLALLIAASLGLSGCGGASGGADGSEADAGEDSLSYPYRVVATTGMVADIVRNVAGEKAEVRGMMGPGVDPHLYKPTRNDVAALRKAEAVFYSGLYLEGKMSDTLVRIATQRKPVVAVTEAIDEDYLLDSEDYEGLYDPHVWMDVAAWKQAVRVVAGELSAFDADNAQHYKSNAEAYLGRLEELDQYVEKVIGTIPEKSRVLVTAHDAFRYFGKAYGVEVMGIQGISTASEAGLEDLNKLVDTLVEREIGAVFVETSVAAKNVKALIEGAGSRGHEVTIGGSLYSDAMGKPGTYEGTYIGMIDHNATVIARSLGGEAPAGGMQGKLEAGEVQNAN